MSDIYRKISGAGTAEADTSSSRQYEAPEQAGHRYGESTETDVEVEAKVADQDELPARDESRQATWGDNPEYCDEAELGAEDDSDVGASLTEEDDLPDRQESRARTWGDDPDYYDDADLTSEYDGDLGTLTAQEDQIPTRQDSRAATWDDNLGYDDADRIEDDARVGRAHH